MCSVADCSNKPKSGGLCSKHYERYRKYGDPLTVKSVPPLPADTQYGRLTVVELVGVGDHRNRLYRCRCVCGSEIIVAGNSLQTGNTRSCGCLYRETVANTNVTHGHVKNGAASRTYSSWSSMRARCENPNESGYENYGGRGITVCERWHSFENFLADMGERPADTTIDRIDSDGNYAPENCRWASVRTQCRNKRNVKLTAEDVALIRAELRDNASPKALASRYGVARSTIYSIKHSQSWREVA